jgi:DNA-binding winged helix-turn-helix (wHTH) protein
MAQTFRFGDFELSLDQRQLQRRGGVIKLNPRYFDVLVLLVIKQGQLVTKDQFFDIVWSGVTVGDEALTQCIKTLRRVLGDDVRQPSFIETVPKHGYRFIAPIVTTAAKVNTTSVQADLLPAPESQRPSLAIALAGMLGGACAGLAGGLIYGYAVALARDTPATGTVLVLFTIALLCVLVGALGSLFVCVGLALGSLGSRQWHTMVGAIAGGAFVGGFANLVGLDAFAIVLGVTPDKITGALEGAVIGGSIGLALGVRRTPGQQIYRTSLACALASALVVAGGGQMMAGSLDSLAAALLASDLPLGRLKPFVPLDRLSLGAEVMLAAVEGLVFGAGVAAGLSVLGEPSHLTQSSHVHHAGAAPSGIGLSRGLSQRTKLTMNMHAVWLGQHRWRIARWLAAALVLLMPLLAMQLSEEVNWGAEDFIWLAVMLTAFGLMFEVGLTWSTSLFYRAGLVMALATGFMLIWVIMAVGMIGGEGNRLNLLYFAMLGGGALVAAQARFAPEGMARALLLLAAGQILVCGVALVAGAGLVQAPNILRLIAANGFFTVLWLSAAALFRRAKHVPRPS